MASLVSTTVNGDLKVTGSSNLFFEGSASSNTVEPGTRIYGAGVTLTGGAYTSVFEYTVPGGLAGNFRFFVKGTTGNVVIPTQVDVLLNHSKDITIKSQSGNYTTLHVKVLTNDNEDCLVQIKADTAANANVTVYIDVIAFGDGSVSFSNFGSYTGTYLEHNCIFGFAFSSINGTTSTARFVLEGNSNGRLGVGTDVVNTDVEISKSSTTNGPVIRLANRNDSISAGGTHGAIEFFSGDNSNPADQVVSSIKSIHVATAPNYGELAFSTGSNSEAVRINLSGNVGIGTTNPSARLDLHAGNMLIGDSYLDHHSTNDNYGLQIKSIDATQAALELRCNGGSNAAGTWRATLYGVTNYYGFLDGAWANWDIRKNVNGALEIDQGSGLETVLTTATTPTWANLGAGTRTNYTLKFQPPSSSYAGFQFLGTNSSNAGFFLIRGTSDSDVYTAEGITLVADQGWLTLAQRSASSRGVKIMTGIASRDRVTVSTNGDIVLGVPTNSLGTATTTTLKGYSVQYDSGGSGARLSNTGFLTWHTGGSWTSNERMWSFTNAYNISGSAGPRFTLLRGNANNVVPTLGNNGSLGTNTLLTCYWSKDGDFYNAGPVSIVTQTLPSSNNFHVSSGSSGSASKSSIAVVSVADNSSFNNGVAALHVINSGNRGTTGNSIGSDLLRLEFSDGIHTIFNKDGSVGIGTTSPDYKLDVSGTLRTTGQATFNTGATISNNQNLNIGTTGSNTGYVRFYNNNATAYYIDWESTGSRAYRFHGTNSGGAFTTTFSQAGSGGHNVSVNGDLSVTGTSTFHGSIDLQDNDKLLLGDSNDLEIYHDGSHSIIHDNGTGDLHLRGNVVRIKNSAGTENMASFVQDGEVALAYNNSTKLTTTSTGVSVTGNLTASGTLDVNGSGQQMASFGNTSARCGIEVKSSSWCEIFFTNPTYANAARIGMAAETSTTYGTSNGDWYVYQPNINNMDLVVKRAGGVSLCGVSGNNVGIGTTNPGKLLQLEGGGLRLPNGYSIDWNNENTRILASHATGYIRFDVSGTSNVLYATPTYVSFTPKLIAGSTSTTGGSWLEKNYTGAHKINVLSSAYSSGNTIIGYGVAGKSGGSGYVATYGNFSGGKAALEVANNAFSFKVADSAAQHSIGDDVTLNTRLTVNKNYMTFTSSDGSGLIVNRTSATAYLQLFPSYSNVPTIMGKGEGGLHLGYNSNTSGIRIDTSNNVIIKDNVLFFGSTTGPFVSNDSTVLRLAGDGGVKIQTYVSGWQDRLTIIDDGNVGIGTTQPSQKLDVNGNTELNGSVNMVGGNWLSFDGEQVLRKSANWLYLADGGFTSGLYTRIKIRVDGYDISPYQDTANVTSATTLGISTKRWYSVYSQSGNFSSHVTLAGDSTSILYFGAKRALEGQISNNNLDIGENFGNIRMRSSSDVFPTNTVDLGTSSNRWDTIYGAAGNFSGTVTANAFSGSGASLTSLNGSNISSGTVAAARLGSGSSITTKFLRGDNTWQTVSGGSGMTTDQYVKCGHRTSAGSNDGGSVTAFTWITRDISHTWTNQGTGSQTNGKFATVSTSSNWVTLDPGDYYAIFRANAVNNDYGQARLETDGGTVLVTSNNTSVLSTSDQYPLIGAGYFTLASEDNVLVKQIAESDQATYGLGRNLVGIGATYYSHNVYFTLEIWKIG